MYVCTCVRGRITQIVLKSKVVTVRMSTIICLIDACLKWLNITSTLEAIEESSGYIVYIYLTWLHFSLFSKAIYSKRRGKLIIFVSSFILMAVGVIVLAVNISKEKENDKEKKISDNPSESNCWRVVRDRAVELSIKLDLSQNPLFLDWYKSCNLLAERPKNHAF